MENDLFNVLLKKKKQKKFQDYKCKSDSFACLEIKKEYIFI